MSKMRKKTSAVIGDPARVAAMNRAASATNVAGHDPDEVMEAEGLQPGEGRGKAGKQRPGGTSRSPRLMPGADPGDAAAVASAHRARHATHKKDAQQLKR